MKNIITNQKKTPVIILQFIIENALLQGFEKEYINKQLVIRFIIKKHLTTTFIDGTRKGIAEISNKTNKKYKYNTNKYKSFF